MISGKPGQSVGYCHPPIETRFRKGQCANPDGRRGKKPSDLDPSSEAARLLGKSFAVVQNGRKTKVTGAQFFTLRLWAKVQEGDLKAMKLWVELFGTQGIVSAGNQNGPGDDAEPKVAEAQEAVIDRYLSRKGWRKGKVANDDQGGSDE